MQVTLGKSRWKYLSSAGLLVADMFGLCIGFMKSESPGSTLPVIRRIRKKNLSMSQIGEEMFVRQRKPSDYLLDY